MRADNHQEPERHADLSLDSALKRHVRFVYEQANRSQRQAAKLLGISRSTLARYLQVAAKK
jgi:predicted XRE-type DNA-binding protein